jgi:hypothetical protein
MKPFDLINRRTHLYLGLFVMPWLVMYGVSSFMLSHRTWFPPDQPPRWQLLFEREYHREVPAQAELRAVSLEILRDCGLEGAFWAQRPKPDEIQIHRYKFRDETRLTYSLKDQRLRAEKQEFKWNQVVVRLHFRGGYHQPTFFNDVWASLVDVACVGILVWIGSGLIMWWRLARFRLWGALALSSGAISFLCLLWRL